MRSSAGMACAIDEVPVLRHLAGDITVKHHFAVHRLIQRFPVAERQQDGGDAVLTKRTGCYIFQPPPSPLIQLRTQLRKLSGLPGLLPRQVCPGKVAIVAGVRKNWLVQLQGADHTCGREVKETADRLFQYSLSGYVPVRWVSTSTATGSARPMA